MPVDYCNSSAARFSSRFTLTVSSSSRAVSRFDVPAYALLSGAVSKSNARGIGVNVPEQKMVRHVV